MIEGQLATIVPLLEETLLLGEARNKMLWLGVVQKLNLDQLFMGFVKCCGKKGLLEELKIFYPSFMKVY